MSYRGRPSKGCENCRTRKVKCDETKPICNRCSKSGSECKYRDQADLLFRNQTAIAAEKAESSWRKRSTKQRNPSESSSGQHSPSSNRLSPETQRRESPRTESSSEPSGSLLGLDTLSLSQELPPDHERLAYERFIYDFVIFETPDIPPGQHSDALWDFVPVLYQQASEGSCLNLAVKAVSYANFASRFKAPRATVLAGDFCGKTIRELRNAIADKQKAATDEVLCTVYLMGVYENLTSPTHTGGYLAHKEGANALLQLRTLQEFYSNPISARLYEVSYSQMITGNLQSAKPPSLPIRYRQPNDNNRRMVPTLYILHAKWHKLKNSTPAPANREDLHDILKEAIELDAECQSFEATLPASWTYQIQTNSPDVRATQDPRWVELILDTRGAPGEIHSFSTAKRAWMWMWYRTTRLFLLRDMTEMLNWALKLPEAETAASKEHMAAPAFSDDQDVPMDFTFTSQAFDQQPQRTPLDTASLRIHHGFTVTHLVNTIEKISSSIIGHFTVPMNGKIDDDVPGMRGYTCFWPLGVMDAILRMGLVPDASTARSRSSTSSPPKHGVFQNPFQSTFQQDFKGTFQGPGAGFQDAGTGAKPFSDAPRRSNPLRDNAAPSPALFRQDPRNISPMYYNPATAVPQEGDFPKLPMQPTFTPPTLAHQPSSANYGASYSPPSRGENLSPHLFDSSAPHPFDFTADMPPLDFTITQPSAIDVDARRAWIHKILAYLAYELGIRKGLAIFKYGKYEPSTRTGIESLWGKPPLGAWERVPSFGPDVNIDWASRSRSASDSA